ncbi:TspO/MBR family protein [Rhodomicrobium vannielii]|nr:TspO/MBR family protein [Rhodomicrobium vannielii]
MALVGFLGLVAAAAALGGQWGARPWYNTLSKPSWTPPNWLFPIAWTVLYVMIAIAGWLIWRTPHPERELLLTLWGAQLLLNALWSYIFFGRKAVALALAELILLWLSIATFTIIAWRVDRNASLLFLPYLIWVSYAGALNAAIWQRNPVRS